MPPTHVDDILVRAGASARTGIMNLLTLRAGELEIPELGLRGAAIELTHCGLEIARPPDGSLTVSQCSQIGRFPPLVILDCRWTQRD